MLTGYSTRLLTAAAGKLCAFAVMSSLLFLTGCSLLPAEEPDLPPPVKAAAPAAPKTAIVKKGLMEVKSMVAGTFVYDNVLDEVFTYKGGFLKNVYVKAGDWVKKGDLLAELENDNLESRIAQERLNLEKAQANLEQVRMQGQIELENARMDLEKASREYEAATAMAGMMSEAELADLRKAVEAAQDKLAKTAGNYRDEGSGKGRIVEQAELMVEESRMRLESMEKDLDACRLYAQRDGMVQMARSKGTKVNINQTIVRIVDPKDLCWVYYGYMAPKFSEGLEVEVRFTGDAYSVEEIEKIHSVFRGIVTEVRNDEKNEQASYAKVKLKEMPWELRDGESAIVTLVTDRAENALIIPTIAVIKRGYLNYVHVVKDGTREERQIEVGLESGGNTQVLSGLEAREEVLLK